MMCVAIKVVVMEVVCGLGLAGKVMAKRCRGEERGIQRERESKEWETRGIASHNLTLA